MNGEEGITCKPTLGIRDDAFETPGRIHGVSVSRCPDIATQKTSCALYADFDGLWIIEPDAAEHGANGALSLTAARCTMVRWNYSNLTFAD